MLILDEERLRTERSDRKNWKSRVTGIEEYGPQGSAFPGANEPPQRRKPERRRQAADEDDTEYKLALEASKYEAEEDEKRRRSNLPVDDDDLAKAIKLSKEEEELRRRELEESNAASLFDDTPAPSTQPQITGYNQGYQQQGAVDWFGNPVDQQPQQPQSTGYLNNAYSQPTGFSNQPTGFQNGFQPQQTGFDPYQQQQQPNYLQQQPTIQPQQTAFDSFNSPYAQQPNNLGNQFQQQQQQQPSSPQAGTHNPWATAQQPQVDALKPAPTGSNNPFASSFGRPQLQQQQTSPPTLSSLAAQKTATPFNNQQPSYNPITSYASPQAPQTLQKEQNPQHARLNALLASGEGMDTFGNTGEMRIPAQHTAPGTFVNSSGQGLNRLHAAQTGNNPFFNQQFTGQQTGAGVGYGAQQPNRLVPAQTGPAGLNGFGGSPFGQANNNPFGTQQHQGQGQGSGSLIDL